MVMPMIILIIFTITNASKITMDVSIVSRLNYCCCFPQFLSPFVIPLSLSLPLSFSLLIYVFLAAVLNLFILNISSSVCVLWSFIHVVLSTVLLTFSFDFFLTPGCFFPTIICSHLSYPFVLISTALGFCYPLSIASDVYVFVFVRKMFDVLFWFIVCSVFSFT